MIEFLINFFNFSNFRKKINEEVISEIAPSSSEDSQEKESVPEKISPVHHENCVYKPHGDPFKVLVVDDNPADIGLFKEALEIVAKELNLPHGIVIASAFSGKDLFLQLNQDRKISSVPDIIFLDINMPGLSGLDCLKVLKKSPRISILPVVMLSTSEDPEDIKRSWVLGCQSYTSKPVDFEGFLVYVRNQMTYWQSSVLLPTRKCR